jgi:hypothetical protein
MSLPATTMSDYAGPNRRTSPRIPAAAVPYLTARVAGGPSVQLMNLSKRGVELATSMYLRPGCTVAVRFLSGDATATLTGAVVRSTVRVLESGSGVTYHTALAFTDELTLCGEEFEAAAAAAGKGDSSTLAYEVTDDYTMIVMDGRTGTPRHAEAPAAC